MYGKILEYEAKTILNKGREEGREEGRIEGTVLTLKKLNTPIQKILEMLQEEYGLTLETAKKYI